MTNKSNKKTPPLGGRGAFGGWLGAVLVIFGCILITVAFFTPPTGIIDPTVLTAFGEILTFAGAIIGIDYHHRVKGGTECESS